MTENKRDLRVQRDQRSSARGVEHTHRASAREGSSAVDHGPTRSFQGPPDTAPGRTHGGEVHRRHLWTTVPRGPSGVPPMRLRVRHLPSRSKGIQLTGVLHPTRGVARIRVWLRLEKKQERYVGGALCDHAGRVQTASLDKLWSGIDNRLVNLGIGDADRDRLLDALWNRLDQRGWLPVGHQEPPHRNWRSQ